MKTAIAVLSLLVAALFVVLFFKILEFLAPFIFGAIILIAVSFGAGYVVGRGSVTRPPY